MIFPFALSSQAVQDIYEGKIVIIKRLLTPSFRRDWYSCAELDFGREIAPRYHRLQYRLMLKSLIKSAKPFLSGDVVDETSGTEPLMDDLRSKILKAIKLMRRIQ